MVITVPSNINVSTIISLNKKLTSIELEGTINMYGRLIKIDCGVINEALGVLYLVCQPLPTGYYPYKLIDKNNRKQIDSGTIYASSASTSLTPQQITKLNTLPKITVSDTQPTAPVVGDIWIH